MPVKLERVPIFVERLVAMSHDLGVGVVTWTVYEPVAMRHLRDAAVGAIITNRPDLLLEVVVSGDQLTPMAARHEVATDL